MNKEGNIVCPSAWKGIDMRMHAQYGFWTISVSVDNIRENEREQVTNHFVFGCRIFFSVDGK